MPMLIARRDHDLVAVPAGVQERVFLECQGRQLDDDVGEADRGCLARAGHRLELLPQVDQVRGVDGRRERDAGGGLCTLDHPLGDRSANGRDERSRGIPETERSPAPGWT